MAYDGSLVFKTEIDGEGFERGVGRITRSAKTALASIAAAFSAKELIEAVVSFGSEAESSMAKVSTLVEGTAEECRAALDDISDSILKTSSATGQAASALSEAAYQALSASVPVERAGQFVDTAAKLATGGFTSTASAVDLLTTAINAYGLDAAEAQKISDSFIATQNKGKTTVDEIAASLGRVAPSAAAFSVSLYDTEAALAQMTKGGIATAESATYLKGMLNELGKDSSRVAQILKDGTGQSFAELMAQGSSLGEVLDTLYDSVGRDATAFANLWSSQEAGTGALSIVNQGARDYAATLDAITDSAGATESAYGKMMDTLDAKKSVFVEGAKNVAIAAYDLIEEPLKSAADKGIEVVGNLAKFIKDNGDKIVKTGKTLLTVVTALTAATVAFKASLAIAKTTSTVASTVKAATAVMKLYAAGTNAAAVGQLAVSTSSKALGTVMALLSGKIKLATAAQALFNGTLLANPVVLVTTAVAGLAAGIGVLIEAQKSEVTAALQELEAFNERHEAVTALIDSQKELAAACDERAATELAQLEHTASLADELFRLTDANGYVTESDRVRAQFIVNELNEALGLEIRMTEGQIEGTEELISTTYRAIEAKRAEILLSAYEAEYTEAIQKRVEAQRAAAAEQIAIAQTESELAELREQHIKELTDLEQLRLEDATEAAMYEASLRNQVWWQELADLQDALEQKQAAYDESAALVDDYYETVANYEAAQAAMLEGNAEQAEALLARMGDAFTTASDVAAKSAEEQSQILGQQYAVSLTMLDDYARKYAEGMTGYTASGLAEMQSYAEQARIEAEEVGVGIVDGQIIGVDGKQIDLNNALTNLQNGGLLELKNGVPSFRVEGDNAGQGYIDGIRDKIQAAYTTGYQLSASAVRGIADGQCSNSPAKKTIEQGEFGGEGYAIGLKSQKREVREASTALTDAALDILSNASIASEFRAAAFASQDSAATSAAATARVVPGDRDEPATPASIDARQYITFERPMQAPDEIARAVRSANRVGLAGARD